MNVKRYLHVRLMMLRPVLSGLCDPAFQSSEFDTDSMQDGMMLKAANLCVSGAQELLQIIEDNMYFKTDLLSPPWYTVFCKSPLSLPGATIVLMSLYRYTQLCYCFSHQSAMLSETYTLYGRGLTSSKTEPLFRSSQKVPESKPDGRTLPQISHLGTARSLLLPEPERFVSLCL
jgi:hypothetical protein